MYGAALKKPLYGHYMRYHIIVGLMEQQFVIYFLHLLTTLHSNEENVEARCSNPKKIFKSDQRKFNFCNSKIDSSELNITFLLLCFIHGQMQNNDMWKLCWLI